MFDPDLILKAGRFGLEFELTRVVPNNAHVPLREAIGGLGFNFECELDLRSLRSL